MIKFSEIQIHNKNDYQELKKQIKSTHIDNFVIERLEKYLGIKCDTVLVEYPYYDSDYLSNYYSHYAQKFRKYDKACYRVHFEFKNEYIGYTVLRPTSDETKFGKTYLNPQLLLKNKAYLMLGDFKAHIHGQEQLIRCFPWKRQEGDISCCAHTATWSVLKYFGNKYKNYADTTIGEIVNAVKNDRGRKTPTLGLTPNQVSDIFKEYDFSPLIIGKDNDLFFIDEILAYVESGLPMVGFFNIAPNTHAVAIMGHGEINYDMLVEPIMQEIVDEKSGVILNTKLIKSIYVMDDRIFPYMEVPKDLPTISDDVKYSMFQMDYAVIPLYSRMQLTYKDVYNRMITWVKSGELKFGDRPVCRIYITSSNSLKQSAMNSDKMNKYVKDVLISLSLPRFVWCIDFADIDSYKKNLITGRIIIDTTSATMEREPWILQHDSNKLKYKDYDNDARRIMQIECEIEPYDMYIHNLQEY